MDRARSGSDSSTDKRILVVETIPTFEKNEAHSYLHQQWFRDEVDFGE
jgi:hypothetical protein